MADNEGEAPETIEATKAAAEEGRTSEVAEEEPIGSTEKPETDDEPLVNDEADKTTLKEEAASETPVAQETAAEDPAGADVTGAGATEGDDEEEKDGENKKGDKPEEEEFGEREEEAAIDAADDDDDNPEERDSQLPTGGLKRSPIPQSDTFAENEESEDWETVQIGEKLSREATPEFEEISILPNFLQPGSPERKRLGLDGPTVELEPEEEPEIDEGQKYDRDALLENYHMALTEREGLLQQNNQLQNKLAEYFRKKKSDERQDHDKNVTDQEQRYLKYMAQLDELHLQHEMEMQRYQQQIEELKTRCEEKRQHVNAEHTRFAEFKKHVAVNAINSRSGKPIAPKDIEQFLVNENKKEQEVVNVRLENIKLKNRLKKKEQQLKSKEELAEGLHLIDFEQLKIENQTYNEKIEERNEELLKLRKKITSTVQVLTHLKEKLQFVQAENQVQKVMLMEVESRAAQKRDILSRTKQARDALRIDNVKLRQKCGLLGNMALLRDFQERRDEDQRLCAKLERLKMQHAELTLACNQVRSKIEDARSPLL